MIADKLNKTISDVRQGVLSRQVLHVVSESSVFVALVLMHVGGARYNSMQATAPITWTTNELPQPHHLRH